MQKILVLLLLIPLMGCSMNTFPYEMRAGEEMCAPFGGLVRITTNSLSQNVTAQCLDGKTVQRIVKPNEDK